MLMVFVHGHRIARALFERSVRAQIKFETQLRIEADNGANLEHAVRAKPRSEGALCTAPSVWRAIETQIRIESDNGANRSGAS
jgi:hypothetical protein